MRKSYLLRIFLYINFPLCHSNSPPPKKNKINTPAKTGADIEIKLIEIFSNTNAFTRSNAFAQWDKTNTKERYMQGKYNLFSSFVPWK